MSELVTLTQTGGIAEVCLNRPEKRNALTPDLLEALVTTADALADADGLRTVVLHGAGDGFCAGLDFTGFGEFVSGKVSPQMINNRTHGDGNLFQAAALVWRDLPVPVIAVLHGFALGGGFQIMLGADIRVAAPDCRFSIMEGRWGLVPDMGGLVLMPSLAREDVIRRLTYTAETFEAPDARDWGFVTELADDPLARARELAAQVAARSPDAVRTAKALITRSLGADRADVLAAESAAQAGLVGQPNQIEAVMANLQKRDPVFRD
ncbi:crotonase/enoyl-CoA hydratase family protein [Oceanomicrobium pacificus]|uniref:Crotonase/enoyl-CoA hydratase family protein n=1 Tax=Oceanomicrobium pacificus TaxID=2692916 RepID=A0A6B0TN93_9RHOB|nr:crotonase/enoyl-CoA hydratase family protein [Oceanomicrobium pacificus]MXU65326.1 crotonase/enoyl-CoA hydratase family protein [Oceanomicrobium pacificus]